MNRLSVSVVIPCWNSEKQLKKHLKAVIAAADRVEAEIIVVDDASTDGSVVYLESLAAQIKLVKNNVNRGFSAAVNRGVAEATGDIVVLLNTDVEPAADCFTKMAPYFTDKDMFAVGFNSGQGSMRILWDKGLFHHFRQEYDAKKNRQPIVSAWASGGQGAFDRHKWLELGGMDTLFAPFYWEDTDLGYRAWKRGWKIEFAPDCRVAHRHEVSVIAGNFDKKHIMRIAQRNQFLFIWKNISDSHLLLTHIFWILKYLIVYPSTVFAAFALLPETVRSRRRSKKLWVKNDKEIITLWKK